MRTLLTAVLFTVSAFAAPIYQAQATLTGVGGASVGGVYTDPYYLTLGTSNLTVYCDDYLDDSAIGDTWTANVFSGLDLTGTYFAATDPNYVVHYRQMFWLTEQIRLGLQDPIAASQALWSIEDSAYVGTSSSNALVAASVAGGLTVNSADFLVIDGATSTFTTATVPHRPQEFIAITPEPGTLVLMSALGALIFVCKRRR